MVPRGHWEKKKINKNYTKYKRKLFLFTPLKQDSHLFCCWRAPVIWLIFKSPLIRKKGRDIFILKYLGIIQLQTCQHTPSKLGYLGQRHLTKHLAGIIQSSSLFHVWSWKPQKHSKEQSSSIQLQTVLTSPVRGLPYLLSYLVTEMKPVQPQPSLKRMLGGEAQISTPWPEVGIKQ